MIWACHERHIFAKLFTLLVMISCGVKTLEEILSLKLAV